MGRTPRMSIAAGAGLADAARATSLASTDFEALPSSGVSSITPRGRTRRAGSIY